MTVTVPIHAIELSPGSLVNIHNLSWQDFETLLLELGEQRHVRVAYYQGTLELMSPLALHERPHRIIADILKTILDVQGRDWEDFGSTRLKRPQIAGIEPDTCFYIQNAALMRGCTDLDLDKYPPPDLAVEADVSSTMTLSAYEAMQVPEVWVYRNPTLKIYVLEAGAYHPVSLSPTLPDLPLIDWIPRLVQQAIDRGTSRMLRKLRSQLS